LINANPKHKEAGVKADIIKGKWFQLKGGIRQRWGKLAADDMSKAYGDAERFIWKLQERYGYARDPGQDLDEFVTSVNIPVKPKR
jgi:uncharacterized protein YjbJ (UPF0337 family)